MESPEQWKQLDKITIGELVRTTSVFNLPNGILVLVSSSDSASEQLTFVPGLIAVEISKADKVILLPIESLHIGLRNKILSAPDKIASFLNEQFENQLGKDKKNS